MTSWTPVRPLVAPLMGEEDDFVSVPDGDSEGSHGEEARDGVGSQEEEIEEAVRLIGFRDPGPSTKQEKR